MAHQVFEESGAQLLYHQSIKASCWLKTLANKGHDWPFALEDIKANIRAVQVYACVVEYIDMCKMNDITSPEQGCDWASVEKQIQRKKEEYNLLYTQESLRQKVFLAPRLAVRKGLGIRNRRTFHDLVNDIILDTESLNDWIQVLSLCESGSRPLLLEQWETLPGMMEAIISKNVDRSEWMQDQWEEATNGKQQVPKNKATLKRKHNYPSGQQAYKRPRDNTGVNEILQKLEQLEEKIEVVDKRLTRKHDKFEGKFETFENGFNKFCTDSIAFRGTVEHWKDTLLGKTNSVGQIVRDLIDRTPQVPPPGSGGSGGYYTVQGARYYD